MQRVCFSIVIKFNVRESRPSSFVCANGCGATAAVPVPSTQGFFRRTFVFVTQNYKNVAAPEGENGFSKGRIVEIWLIKALKETSVT